MLKFFKIFPVFVLNVPIARLGSRSGSGLAKCCARILIHLKILRIGNTALDNLEESTGLKGQSHEIKVRYFGAQWIEKILLISPRKGLS